MASLKTLFIARHRDSSNQRLLYRISLLAALARLGLNAGGRAAWPEEASKPFGSALMVGTLELKLRQQIQTKPANV